MIRMSSWVNDCSTIRTIQKIKPTMLKVTNEQFESILFLQENKKRIDEGGLRLLGQYKKSLKNKPLLTIITPVFNGKDYLEETILSVLSQTYDNVEYIIIDGGSTDGSLDIIKKYTHVIDYWVSEPDEGISDAFNKGVRLACGDYINFQGDGDGFYSTTVLEKIIQGVNYSEDIFISGQIQRVTVDGKEMYISKFNSKFNKKSLLINMSMPHQGLFTNLRYFKKYGLFDIKNIYCMDYDHLLRSYREFPAVIMKNIIVAKWRADGLGENKDLEVFQEYHKIKIDNKIAAYPVLMIINFLIRAKYVINKLLNV